MKNVKTYLPCEDGTVYDSEIGDFRKVTLAELLDRIYECQRYCRDNAAVMDHAEAWGDEKMLATALDSVAWFGSQAQVCMNLINAGNYAEVNNYAV